MKCEKLPEEEWLTELSRDGVVEYVRGVSEVQIDSASSFSNGCRKTTPKDVEFVKNLIERCLQLYMTKEEVVTVLANRAKVQPHFIHLVWQLLEQENSEFFSAYHVRLMLKKQIREFNRLLKKQYELTNNTDVHNAPQPSLHNGFSHIPANSYIGYPVQQPYLPLMGATDMEALYYGYSDHVVKGVPAADNFYPIQQNVDAASDHQEMAQYSFEWNDLRMNGQPMTFGALFPSNMCSTDGGSGTSSDNPDIAAVQSYHCVNYQLADVPDDVAGTADEYDCDIDSYFNINSPFEETHNPIDEEKA